MKLFSKEKGIVLSILNAVFIIWIVAAIVVAVTNASHLIVKDVTYTYDEYKIFGCTLDEETEEDCNDYYKMYLLDEKNLENEYKRNIMNAIVNVVLVSGALIILNVEKKKK